MSSRFTLFVAATALAMPTQLLFAQYTISVHSGQIQYTSGAVTVGGLPIQKTTTNILSLKNGEVLATGADGAAEVLMTPGVFVRMVSDSSLRMDSISLADTRVTILTGAVMVECAELIKGDNVTFFVGPVPGAPSVELRKQSLFRIDAQPPKVSVLRGEVFAGGVTVTKDKMLALGLPVLQPEKFRLNKQDDLYLFSEARSADSAYASNVVSQSVYNAGGTCLGSSWYYMNPVGMYAYVPCDAYAGMFGYPFYGVNYGYQYFGIPYYCPPPGIFKPSPKYPPKPLPIHPAAPVVTPERSSLIKVPAFVSVLETKPTTMWVSRATYVPNMPGAANQSLSGVYGAASARGGATVNRYMAATSLHGAPSQAGRGASSQGYGGGGYSGSAHYGGGSAGSSYSGGGSSHVSAVSSSAVSSSSAVVATVSTSSPAASSHK